MEFLLFGILVFLGFIWSALSSVAKALKIIIVIMYANLDEDKQKSADYEIEKF